MEQVGLEPTNPIYDSGATGGGLAYYAMAATSKSSLIDLCVLSSLESIPTNKVIKIMLYINYPLNS